MTAALSFVWKSCAAFIFLGLLCFVSARRLFRGHEAKIDWLEFIGLIGVFLGSALPIAIGIYFGVFFSVILAKMQLIVITATLSVGGMFQINRRATLYGFCGVVFVSMIVFVIIRGADWYREVEDEYHSSIQFDEILQANMINEAPRGTEPTGEIWVRSDAVPWFAKMRIVGPHRFKTFKTDSEALTILRPMIGNPVYLQSLNVIASYPGILAEINHIDADPDMPNPQSDEMVIVQSRSKRPDPVFGDIPTTIPLRSVGAIYVYREVPSGII